MQKTVLTTALTISLLMIPILAHTEVYKWVDEKGTVHFTDDNSRIPEKYGKQVERRTLSEDPKPMTEEKKTEKKTAVIPSYGSDVGETILLFSGLITTVGSGTIAVRNGGMDMVFLISEGTNIKNDYGQRATFSDLINGRPVTIEYIKKGNDNHANSVTVSVLQAGSTNVSVGGGPGQFENPSETQKKVWVKQKAHKKSTSSK